MDKNENKPNYKKISPNYNWENEIAVPENLEENKFSGYPTPPSKIFSINDIARLAEEEESRITIEATATSPIASDTSINNHGQTYSHRSPEPLPADVLKTTTSSKAEEEAQRLGDEKAKLAIELAEKRKAAIAAKQAAENAMRKVEEETRRKEAEAHRHAAEMIHREAEETEAKRKLAEETRRKEILTTQLQFQEPYNLHAQTGKQTPIFPPPTTTASQTTDEEARILAMAEAKRATEKAVQKVAAEAHQKAADSQYQMSPTTNQPLQTTIKNNIIPGVFNQNFMQNQPTTSKPQTIDNRHANLETINQTDNLPYPDTNLEGLFKLASEAESQAQFAATAARNASTAAHANMMNMTPENPVVANKIQQSTFAAAKNAVEAAKAALKAQSSAMEATAAAISQSMRELDRNKALIQQQETSIIKLNANMDNAQTAISKALEAFRAAKMKAEEEAARIQEYKNQLFQAAQEKQALEQYMLKAQENLNFAHVRARETRANYLNIQTLTEATEKDLYCIVHSIPLQQPYPATPVSINYQNQTNTQPLFPDQNNSSAKNTPAEAPNREQTIDIEVSRPPEVDEPEQKPTLKAMLWSYGKLVIIAFAIAFLLRAFVFEVTQVEGPSMSPTLVTDDKLITSKLAYTFGQPQRGDIVVLDAPDAEGQYYIKRVIGLPNERITIKDGRVYINDLNLTETYLTQLLTDGDVDLLIPEGYYFVMGDNRGDSRDSRMESVGLISKNALDGKAVFRIYPWDKMGSLYQ